MSKHELKTWPEFFEPVAHGDKTFELRFNDRDYQPGDVLHLREFTPCRVCKGKGQQAVLGMQVDPFACDDCAGTGGTYTGRSVWRMVSYVLNDHPALLRGNVVLGLHL